QCKFLMTAYTAPMGTGFVTVTSEAGASLSGTTQIDALAPSMFTAGASGQGLPAVVALRMKADGSQSYEEVVFFDQGLNKFVARPIDLGPDLGASTDQVFLILYGTGIRNRNSLFSVRAGIG